MKRLALFLLLYPCAFYSLEKMPWYGDVYEFQLEADFSYSRYKKINNAIEQPKHAYNNYVPCLGVGFVASEAIAFDCEVELAQTPHQSFGFRSSAVQGRYRLLDDIAGDPVSLTFGVDLRGVSGTAVRDVSSPYSSYFNMEASAALGKELSTTKTWKIRGYVWGALGVANQGLPWLDSRALFQANFQDVHRLALFVDGYFGFGHKHRVDIHHFHGWGRFHHLSIDLAAQYQYVFPLWGSLGISYAYRVFAKSYPQGQQTVMLSYTLPFSLF